MNKFPKIALFLSSFWLILLFLFNKHYVDTLEAVESWFVAKGLIYYKDFAAYHFPLGKIVMIPIHHLTSWNFATIPIIGLFIGLSTLLLIYYFGKRFLSQKGTVAALLFFSFLYWYTATQILYYHTQLLQFFLMGAIFLYFSLDQSKQKLSKFKIFFLGVLLSLTELTQQLASVTILFFTILVIILTLQRSSSRYEFAKNITIFLLGGFIPLLILSIYFYLNNAFSDFYKWNIPYYLTYAHSPTAGIIPTDKLLIVYAPVALLILIIVSASKKLKIDLTLACLAITTLPVIIFGVFHWYHVTYALPILTLCFGRVFSTTSSKLISIAKHTLLTILTISLIFIIIPWHLSQKGQPSLMIYNDIQPGDGMYEAVLWTKTNTSENSRFMVIGNSLFYVRSNRLPASRPNKGIVYAWEPFNEVKKELIAKPPDYWVIAHPYLRRMIPDYKKDYMVNFINQQLNNCYKQEYKNIGWEIWGKDITKKCS